MRLHDGRVYLMLGCNMECSIYAHGHLNLMLGRRHLGLRGVLTTLTAGHAHRDACHHGPAVDRRQAGIHNIQHVVVIMQENRSFDQCFGTYPGANGILAGLCEPDPVNSG